MIEVLFAICILIWCVNNYVSRQRNGMNRRNKSTILIIEIAAISIVKGILHHFLLTVCTDETFHSERGDNTSSKYRLLSKRNNPQFSF